MKIFDLIWIQPAAGDASGALGAALGAYHMMLIHPRKISNNSATINGSYLEPEFHEHDICERLARSGAVFEILNEDDLLE
jgi:carbamoyltransferase